ncbi:hypothetical protein BH23GEM9_BH23GEM9_13800 [soil metagenome]
MDEHKNDPVIAQAERNIVREARLREEDMDAEFDTEVKAAVRKLRGVLGDESERIWLKLRSPEWSIEEIGGVRAELCRLYGLQEEMQLAEWQEKIKEAEYRAQDEQEEFYLAVEEEILHKLLGYCKKQRRRIAVRKFLRARRQT